MRELNVPGALFSALVAGQYKQFQNGTMKLGSFMHTLQDTDVLTRRDFNMPCKLCEAAPHPPVETYTEIVVEDPMSGGDAVIPVCLEHYEVIEDAIK